VAATKDTLHVVWTGANVTAKVPTTLQLGAPVLTVNSPASVAGIYAVGTAQFGPPLAAPGITDNLVLVNDGTGPDTADACEPILNSLAGSIAILNRGTCTFVIKVKNAQNAGAIAVVVADNAAGSPPAGMAGVDPTITIPSVRISQPNGNALKAALISGTVNVTVGVNPAVRAGADPAGRALIYTPVPVAGGSSLSHWDVSAFPNTLMEPAINSDLTHNVDLTLPAFRDEGWAPDADLDGVVDSLDQCANSNLAPTVVIGTCNSGVGNTLFTTGCTISDLVRSCGAGAGNHGAFVSCVAHLTDALKAAGIISGAQKGSVQTCAGGASIP